MNTVQTWQIESTSSDDTERIAENVGRALRGGEVIELASDLGGGKTTFTRGLVRGMGSSDRVASPTFTLSRVYQAGSKQVHHFDFYRLPEPGLMREELAEVLNDPDIVTVVEWAEALHHTLPKERLTIAIAHTPTGARTLTFTAPQSLAYLLEAAKQ